MRTQGLEAWHKVSVCVRAFLFSSEHDKEEKIYDISDSQELIYDEYGIRDYPVIESNRFVIKMKSGIILLLKMIL